MKTMTVSDETFKKVEKLQKRIQKQSVPNVTKNVTIDYSVTKTLETK